MKDLNSCLKSESGTMLLLVGGFLLPVAGIFLLFGLQITQLRSTNSRLQHTVDTAALVAAKKLPYTREAEEAARAILDENGFTGKTNIQISSNEVSITALASKPSFSNFIFPKKNSVSHYIAARSKVVTNKKNIAIFLDAGSYVAPSPTANENEAWNHGSDSWPTARFFNINHQRLHRRNSGINELIRTQQCFNSALSPLKEVAIRLYDYYSTSSSNAVSVLMAPGSIESVTTLKNLAVNNEGQILLGEGRFDFYSDSQFIASDYWCLAAAKHERNSGNPGYQVPDRAITGNNNSNAYPDSSRSLFPLDSLQIPSNLSRHLSMRDILWSIAARRSNPDGAGVRVTNFENALRRTVREVLGHQHKKADGTESIYPTSRTAIMLMGDIPWVSTNRFSGPISNSASSDANGPSHSVNLAARNSLRQTILTLRNLVKEHNSKVQVYLSVTKHLGNYPPAIYPYCVSQADDGTPSICEQFNYDMQQLNRLIRQTAPPEDPYLQIHLFKSPDTESLVKSLPAWIPLIDRSLHKVG